MILCKLILTSNENNQAELVFLFIQLHCTIVFKVSSEFKLLLKQPQELYIFETVEGFIEMDLYTTKVNIVPATLLSFINF